MVILNVNGNHSNTLFAQNLKVGASAGSGNPVMVFSTRQYWWCWNVYWW